jgi:hypothetical protein
MEGRPATDLFHGLFEWRQRTLIVHKANTMAPRTIPDPHTGRPLRVATVEVTDRGVCPSCAQLGAGGYVTFVSDLRLAFACASCRKLVWTPGA